MSSLKTLKTEKHKLINTKSGLVVYGYVRQNFDKKCWIEELMPTIIQFYMVKGGSLYMFGSGNDGRLGIDQYNCYKTRKIPTLSPRFQDDNAYKVVATNSHTLILDTYGTVWGCGNARDGQLGNGQTNKFNVPKKLKNFNRRVISVSAGTYHSLLLCDNGWVHSFGSNTYGQLGHSNLDCAFVPTTIKELKEYQIVQICAGNKYSVALTRDGNLFCFGSNSHGQCGVGMGNGKNIKTPTKVDLDKKIVFVECGSVHTLIITRKGLIYSFGNGYYGKLGHSNQAFQYSPALILALKEKRIAACAAGSIHSLCVDEDGIVWSFGSNESGQCGLPSNILNQHLAPTKVEWFIDNKIKAKYCAAGFHQSCVVAEDERMYVFGNNKDHQLGLPATEPKIYFTPTKLSLPDNKTVKCISMGAKHTAMISN